MNNSIYKVYFFLINEYIHGKYEEVVKIANRTSTIGIRVDKEERARFMSVAYELGMDVSSATRYLFKKAHKELVIPQSKEKCD